MKWCLVPLLVVGLVVSACDSSFPTEALEDATVSSSVLGKQAPPDGAVFNDKNGNYYMVVEDLGIFWNDANDAATGMGFGQCESHLAVITSANENAWITATFPAAAQDGYWLGGQQAEGSTEPADGWYWVTGEDWLYTNWAGGEPNDLGGEESLQFAFFEGDGTWNDQAFWNFAGGYIVEFECPRAATGGGQVLRDLGEGNVQKRVYGFNARKGADASVKGQAQGTLIFDGTFAFHMDVTCMSIWDNNVWLGGAVRTSNDPAVPIGREYLWRFVDNGQGNNADNDRVSFYLFFPDGSPIANQCALQMVDGNNSDRFELVHGNITIR